MTDIYLLSACLCGINCRYDGSNSEIPEYTRLVAAGKAIPVCPEQMGGLPTPRVRCEIKGGDGHAVLEGQARVYAADGQDLTRQFIEGAREVLKVADSCDVRAIILKSRSPSCGCGEIYDGSFSGRVIAGDGVTTALLRQHGFTVYTDQDGAKGLPRELE